MRGPSETRLPSICTNYLEALGLLALVESMPTERIKLLLISAINPKKSFKLQKMVCLHATTFIIFHSTVVTNRALIEELDARQVSTCSMHGFRL